MQKNIDYICRQVRDLMIIETHEVRDERWHARYVQRIIPHFAHWCCFGRVIHGREGSYKRRLWLAFSNTDLTTFYSRRARSLLPDAEGIVQSTCHGRRLTSGSARRLGVNPALGRAPARP